jgi:hypothetical protein
MIRDLQVSLLILFIFLYNNVVSVCVTMHFKEICSNGETIKSDHYLLELICATPLQCGRQFGMIPQDLYVISCLVILIKTDFTVLSIMSTWLKMEALLFRQIHPSEDHYLAPPSNLKLTNDKLLNNLTKPLSVILKMTYLTNQQRKQRKEFAGLNHQPGVSLFC